MSDPNLPGLDLGLLHPWFAEHVPGASGDPLEAALIAGGKSNLTYTITNGSHSWVLRRPPLGHVLATAHDMRREYRVMAALAATAVPVPHMVAFGDQTEVLGVPFYVMEQIAGTPYRHATELQALGPDRTRRISEQLIDTLATLSAIDPATIGLADFGRPEGFLRRQLERWHHQFEASRSRDMPTADELHAALARAIPTEASAGIVHGDFRLDNVLIDANDRLTAVIDWEMATLGDPLTDLALMLVYQRASHSLGTLVTDAPTAPGFLTEHEILERYAANGRDLSQFGWYLGLAAYKLATIAEGIHYRHAQGKTVGDGFAGTGEAVAPLLHAGLTSLKEHA